MALKDNASLALIPAAYKTSKIYSAIPTDGDGDFTFTRSGNATRINKAGLVETMGTNIGRLNYDLTNGTPASCPSLLLERSRTNQFTNSENLANIDFQTNSTITTDNIIAPNGSLTADKTTQTSGGYLRETVSVSNGTTYSFSVFLKKGDLRYAVIRSLFSQNGTTTANSNSVFDLDNGSVTYTGTDIVSASIEAYTNDWYRCSFVSLASGTGSAPFIDFYFTSSSSSTQASGTSGFGYGWGMQLEAGTYPTSYIQTTGIAAVTRTVDTCSIANFANLPTDYPLTVYWKGQVKEFSGSNCAFSIYKDGAAGEFLAVSFQSSSLILVRRAVGGSEDLDFISHSYSLGDVLKIGIKFTSATTFKLFIDGLEIYEETSGVSKTWDFNSVLIGQLRVAADAGDRNPCDELMLFNEALSDSELQALTT
jgi:hypothetical protein